VFLTSFIISIKRLFNSRGPFCIRKPMKTLTIPNGTGNRRNPSSSIRGRAPNHLTRSNILSTSQILCRYVRKLKSNWPTARNENWNTSRKQLSGMLTENRSRPRSLSSSFSGIFPIFFKMKRNCAISGADPTPANPC